MIGVWKGDWNMTDSWGWTRLLCWLFSYTTSTRKKWWKKCKVDKVFQFITQKYREFIERRDKYWASVAVDDDSSQESSLRYTLIYTRALTNADRRQFDENWKRLLPLNLNEWLDYSFFCFAFDTNYWISINKQLDNFELGSPTWKETNYSEIGGSDFD